MATFTELYNLKNDSTLKNKVMVACIVVAETIMNEDGGTINHTNRLIWAKSVFANPSTEANRMFMAVLSANSAASVVAIQGAPDETIQTNVDNHVDLFADGS